MQYFNVDFDTGSSDLWVVSELCDTSCDDYELSKYDPVASSTYEGMEESFEIEYADGELMQGKHGRETLNWAGYEITDQIFAQVTHLNDYAMCVQEDGIFGLAFSSISSHNFTSPVKNAVDKNVLPHNVFSLYLDEKDDFDENDQLIEGEDHILSRLIVGGIDPNLYDGCITDNWHDVAKGTFNGTSELHGLWDVNLASIHLEMNNENIYTFSLSEEDAFLIFDSGSTNLIGPFESVSSYAVEANATCFSFGTDYLGEPIMEEEECQPDFFWFGGWDVAQVDCNASLPDLIFTTEKSKIRFTRDDLVIEFFDEDEGELTCFLKLQGSPGFFPGWVLGDVFMQSYYTLFDRDTERVAFAPSLPRGGTRTEDVCEGDINLDVNEDVEEDTASPSVILIDVDGDDLEIVPVPVPAPVIDISSDTEVPTLGSPVIVIDISGDASISDSVPAPMISELYSNDSSSDDFSSEPKGKKRAMLLAIALVSFAFTLYVAKTVRKRARTQHEILSDKDDLHDTSLQVDAYTIDDDHEIL